MHDARLGRKRCSVPRYAIAEARADREEEVALLYCHVRRVGAVHPRHPGESLGLCGDAADAHERRDRRHPRQSEEFTNLLRSIREHNTAADEEQRLLRRGKSLRCRPHRCGIKGGLARIAVQLYSTRIAIVDLRIEHILCHVDDDDARTPRPRDIKRLFDDARQIRRVLHEIIMLRNRRRNTHDVRLLERIFSNVRICHLSRDADHRHRVHMCRRNPRHEIRRAGSRCCKYDADLPRRAGVPVCRMCRALLMTRQHMPEPHFINFVIQRKHRAARIAKDDLDALLFQTL